MHNIYVCYVMHNIYVYIYHSIILLNIEDSQSYSYFAILIFTNFVKTNNKIVLLLFLIFKVITNIKNIILIYIIKSNNVYVYTYF